MNYEYLLSLSLSGEHTYLPDGLDELVNVGLLLNGVASPTQQRADKTIFNIHISDDIRAGDIVDGNGVAIGREAQANLTGDLGDPIS